MTTMTTEMTPTTMMLVRAWKLARAYGHAWGGPEGEALVDLWYDRGAVPPDWRERLREAVEPTFGAVAGIAAPTAVTVCYPERPALVHETATGRISWRIEHVAPGLSRSGALLTEFTLTRPVGAAWADAIAAAPVDRLPEVLDLLRRERGGERGGVPVAQVALTEDFERGICEVELRGFDLRGLPMPARPDHWQSLGAALVAAVGSWPDVRDLIAEVAVEEFEVEQGLPRARAKAGLLAACEDTLRAIL